jgi:hypothetical protein
MGSAGGSKVLRFLFVLYYAEAGALLALAPWSRFWMRRVVLRSPEGLQPLLASPFFRSLIVGIGVLHLWTAIRDLEAWRRSLGRRVDAAPVKPAES